MAWDPIKDNRSTARNTSKNPSESQGAKGLFFNGTSAQWIEHLNECIAEMDRNMHCIINLMCIILDFIEKNC